MEEEDEMSHPSPTAIGSPENGRITVTVASTPPPPTTATATATATETTQTQAQQLHQQNTLALALPSQRNGGGREDCWSEGATAVLVEAWGERYLELSRGNLKQKHWKEVADIVSSREDYTKTPKTDIQCKNRIDTVKKKYKLEKTKFLSGSGASKWVFFEKLDQLIGPTAKIPVTPKTTGVAIAGSSSSRVPMGIPVGVRNQIVKESNVFGSGKRMELRKRSGMGAPVEREVEEEEEEESEEESRGSMDSFPPEKRRRVVACLGTNKGKEEKGGGGGGWGDSVRMLTRAILKFGEAYEQAESAKLQQVVEMEKQRMKFAKELELQRMQFFMKTQLEISQLKYGRRTGNASNHHRSNDNGNNNNNSDSSN